MKLVKTLSAIAAVAVLAACSNSAKKEQPVVVKSEKTVVYSCGKYTWNVDTGFTLDNTTEVDAVMLTQKGKKSDKILAKHCSINAKATAKANQ